MGNPTLKTLLTILAGADQHLDVTCAAHREKASLNAREKTR
jgi:hypothetical protein